MRLQAETLFPAPNLKPFFPIPNNLGCVLLDVLLLFFIVWLANHSCIESIKDEIFSILSGGGHAQPSSEAKVRFQFPAHARILPPHQASCRAERLCANAHRAFRSRGGLC